MTKLEKTVEALRRCIPADKFEKAMAEVEATEARTNAPECDAEAVIRGLLTEIGTPDHVKGHRYIVTALRMVVDRPDLIDAMHKELYPGVAAAHNTTYSRAERAIRHAIELTWARGDWDVLGRYFGNTVSPTRGKPTNSEFLARLANVVRLKVKEAQR